MSPNEEFKIDPDSVIPCDAAAFYGDSWAEAVGRAAFYLNAHHEIDKGITEPMIRMVHYPTYEKPYTCTLVFPAEVRI